MGTQYLREPLDFHRETVNWTAESLNFRMLVGHVSGFLRQIHMRHGFEHLKSLELMAYSFKKRAASLLLEEDLLALNMA